MIEKQAELEAILQPVVKSIRGAGFSCSYHFSSTLMRYDTTAYAEVTTKDLPNWRGSVYVSMNRSTLAIQKVSIKAEGTRTITCKKLDADKILSILRQGLDITKNRYQQAEVSQQAEQRFSEQRAKDFAGWTIPQFLVYSGFGFEKRPEYLLWNLRSDVNHTLGRYRISGENLQGCLRDLTSNQVKDLCNYLQHILPNIK